MLYEYYAADDQTENRSRSITNPRDSRQQKPQNDNELTRRI